MSDYKPLSIDYPTRHKDGYLYLIPSPLFVSTISDWVPVFNPIYFPHLISAEYIYLIQIITLIHVQLGTCIIPETRFLPGEKQYLILAITLYRLGTCISSMPPPSAPVNSHDSYESINLSSYRLATCFSFHISSIFLICMIPVFHAMHYPDPL